MECLPPRPSLPPPNPFNGTFLLLSLTDQWCNWVSRLFDAEGNVSLAGPPPEDDSILVVQLVKLYLLVALAVGNHTELPVSSAQLAKTGRDVYFLSDSLLRLEHRPALFTAKDGEVITCYLPDLLTDEMKVLINFLTKTQF